MGEGEDLMGKGKKQKTPLWGGAVQGVLLALGFYLGSLLLLALGMTRGAVPEGAAVPAAAALAVCAAFLGGLRLMLLRGSWGPLPGAMLVSGIFALTLILVGLSLGGGAPWSGEKPILLLSALAGGVLAGLCGGRTGKRGKKRFW